MSIQLSICAIKLPGDTKEFAEMAGFDKPVIGVLNPDGTFGIGPKLTQLTIVGQCGIDEKTKRLTVLVEHPEYPILNSAVALLNKKAKTSILMGYLDTNLLTGGVSMDDYKLTLSKELADKVASPTLKMELYVGATSLDMGEDETILKSLQASANVSNEPTTLETAITKVALSSLEPSKQWLQNESNKLGYGKTLENINSWLGTAYSRWDKLVEDITLAKSEGLVTATNSESF